MTKPNIVMPNYNHSILSTITSILKYYNVETPHNGSPKLDQKLTQKQYKNVVFILLDGLGEHILNNVSKNGYLNTHKIDCVTSVYPSTTTAALTTYYSGKPPYETGWIAWSQYFKEYGRCIDMLSRRESYEHSEIENPLMDVFKNVVNYESIFKRIEKASPDVVTYELKPDYADALSDHFIIANDINTITNNIKNLCKDNGKKFIFAYSDNPDKLLHQFGTKSIEVKDFILDTENKINAMIDELDEETIVIISADHGHKDIKKAYTLLDYPAIQECLIMPPFLESRVISFFVKPDMHEEFQKRFNETFKEEFWLMSKQEFLVDHQMLGEGTKHPKIDDFIGDYVALSMKDSMIRIETYLAPGKPVKSSTHCGLSKEEMEVPLIVLTK